MSTSAWGPGPIWQLDVHRARVFGRCEVKSGIAPLNRLVGEVMGQEPYKSARRVFWIMAGTPTVPARLSGLLRALGIALQLDLLRRDLHALLAKIALRRLAHAA